MSGKEVDQAEHDSRSFLSGGIAGLGALAVGSGVASAGDDDTNAKRPARDVTKIDSCTTITEPGYYALTADLQADPEDVCIEIRCSHVLLDGNGHTIKGRELYKDDDDPGTAVLVQSPSGDQLSNVMVTNLSIVGLGTGILFDRVQNGAIVDVTTDIGRQVLGDMYGIHLRDSTSCMVQRSHVGGSSEGQGISVRSSHHCAVLWNTVDSWETGIGFISGSKKCLCFGNTVDGTRNGGLVLYEAEHTKLYGNTLRNNSLQFQANYSNGNLFASNTFREGGEGMFFNESDGNAFVGNTVDVSQLDVNSSEENLLIGNRFDGFDRDISAIRFSDAHRNKIVGTTVTDCDEHGIEFEQSNENLLHGNLVANCEDDGIRLRESHRNKISRSVLERNGGHGFGIHDSKDNYGRGNRARSNGDGPIVVVGGAGNSIEVDGTT